MKNIFLLGFILISFSIFKSYAQGADIVYPISGDDSITDCHIIKIKGWNTIIFEKNDFQDTVLAIAAIKNGRFIDFRTRKEIKDNAYPLIFSIADEDEKEMHRGEQYYQLQYQNAIKQRKGGATLSLVGAFTGITTYVIMYRNSKNNHSTKMIIPTMFFGGGILFNLGTPFWISGGIKAKKSEEAMLKEQHKDISINFGMTNNGISIVFGF